MNIREFCIDIRKEELESGKDTTIYFSKIRPDTIIPSKLEENAGYDVYANFDENEMIIYPHETKMIPTGIASACSKDYYFQLFERGSTGSNGIAQRCGVIDSGYRNEWFVPLTNTTDMILKISKHVDKVVLHEDYEIIYPYSKGICQAVLLPVPKAEVKEIPYEELLEMKSERGLGNLGSSNK